MGAKMAARLLLMTVFMMTGTCSRVSLTKQAEKFIDRMGNAVDTWGLTEDYTYWTERMNRSGQYPIRGKVEKYECNVSQFQGTPGRMVKAQFTWTVTDSLESPFQLLVNLTVPGVPIKGLEGTTLLLDLNNGSNIIAYAPAPEQVSATKALETQRTCSFTAKVTLRGYFAYHVARPRGDDGPYYWAAPVARLENIGEGLVSEGDDLAYTIKGLYTEDIWTQDD